MDMLKAIALIVAGAAFLWLTVQGLAWYITR